MFGAIRGSDGFDSTADEVEHDSVDCDRVNVRVGVSNDFFPHELSERLVGVWKRSATALGWDGKCIFWVFVCFKSRFT